MDEIDTQPNGAGDAARALETGEATVAGRARAMVALCRAARLPARLVSGFLLEEAPQAQPHVWLETRVNDQWRAYDPERGLAEPLPADALPVRRGGAAIVRATDARELDVGFSMEQLDEAEEPADGVREAPWTVFFLRRLPSGMQLTLAVLLLVPVGALVTSLCRNIIGLQTYGTFTPSLLALSFIYADWRTGTLILAFVIGIGLASKPLLNRMRLLMVPRLSLILTLVVLVLTFTVSGLDYLRLTPSARAVLLPLVILTMLIERFDIRVQEDGLRPALLLMAHTLIVAAACFPVFQWESLRELFLSYPESLLVVAALLIVIGRYTGYRLNELWRFRDLARKPEDGQ